MFLCERDVVRKLLCIYNLACLAAERVTATSADTPHVAIATTHEDAITPYAYSHRSWPRPTPAGTVKRLRRGSRGLSWTPPNILYTTHATLPCIDRHGLPREGPCLSP